MSRWICFWKKKKKKLNLGIVVISIQVFIVDICLVYWLIYSFIQSFLCFWDRVSQCSSDRPRTQYINQAVLKLTERSTCFCHQSAGIKGVLYQAQLWAYVLNKMEKRDKYSHTKWLSISDPWSWYGNVRKVLMGRGAVYLQEPSTHISCSTEHPRLCKIPIQPPASCIKPWVSSSSMGQMNTFRRNSRYWLKLTMNAHSRLDSCFGLFSVGTHDPFHLEMHRNWSQGKKAHRIKCFKKLPRETSYLVYT